MECSHHFKGHDTHPTELTQKEEVKNHCNRSTEVCVTNCSCDGASNENEEASHKDSNGQIHEEFARKRA